MGAPGAVSAQCTAPGPALFGWRAELYSSGAKVAAFLVAYAVIFLLWERTATVKMAGWLRSRIVARQA